jgi:hypothetical protein
MPDPDLESLLGIFGVQEFCRQIERVSRRNFRGTAATALTASGLDRLILVAEPEIIFGSQLYE